MDEYIRIYLPLSKAEFKALQERAQQDYRHPRDQARYLLRDILLSEKAVETNNRQDALVCDGQSIKAVGA